MSDGPYFRPEAAYSLPPGTDIGDYRESVLGQDISFAWHHLQLWAEFYEVRFEVPRVGDANTFVYYLEAKYKFTPQFFGAIRWNQQFFDDVPVGGGATMRWATSFWNMPIIVSTSPFHSSTLKTICEDILYGKFPMTVKGEEKGGSISRKLS